MPLQDLRGFFSCGIFHRLGGDMKTPCWKVHSSQSQVRKTGIIGIPFDADAGLPEELLSFYGVRGITSDFSMSQQQ